MRDALRVLTGPARAFHLARKRADAAQRAATRRREAFLWHAARFGTPCLVSESPRPRRAAAAASRALPGLEPALERFFRQLPPDS